MAALAQDLAHFSCAYGGSQPFMTPANGISWIRRAVYARGTFRTVGELLTHVQDINLNGFKWHTPERSLATDQGTPLRPWFSSLQGWGGGGGQATAPRGHCLPEKSPPAGMLTLRILDAPGTQAAQDRLLPTAVSIAR